MKNLESKDYDGAVKAINDAQTHFRVDLPPPVRPKSAARGPERLHALGPEKYESCIDLLKKAKKKQDEQPKMFDEVLKLDSCSACVRYLSCVSVLGELKVY